MGWNEIVSLRDLFGLLPVLREILTLDVGEERLEGMTLAGGGLTIKIY